MIQPARAANGGPVITAMRPLEALRAHGRDPRASSRRPRASRAGCTDSGVIAHATGSVAGGHVEAR